MKKITMLLMGLFLILCFAVSGMSAVPDQAPKDYGVTLYGDTVTDSVLSDSQNSEKGYRQSMSVYGLTLAVDKNKVDIYTLIKNHNYLSNKNVSRSINYKTFGNKDKERVLVACRSCNKPMD